MTDDSDRSSGSSATDKKRATATSFGAAADSYLDSDVHRQGADLDQLASWCADATSALDVATGAGHTAGAIVLEGVPEVVAADVSRSMVTTAEREFTGVVGVVADAERLPFADDSFDAVSCRIAAHHFPDPKRFVAEVSRVLVPGGTFAFEDNVVPEDEALGSFINRVDELRDPTHIEAYTTAQWHEWIAHQGFIIEETLHLTRTVPFDQWIETQSLPPRERERVERLLLNASDEAVKIFDIQTDGETVSSFSNWKALIRATNRS